MQCLLQEILDLNSVTALKSQRGPVTSAIPINFEGKVSTHFCPNPELLTAVTRTGWDKLDEEVVWCSCATVTKPVQKMVKALLCYRVYRSVIMINCIYFLSAVHVTCRTYCIFITHNVIV